MSKTPTQLTSKEQNALYEKWLLTGDDHYRAQIAISYTDCINALIYNTTSGNTQLLDTPDIKQDILMLVYNAILKYDKTKSGLFTYIYKICYTKIIDKLRYSNVRTKRRTYLNMDDILNDDTPEEAFVSKNEKQDKIDEMYYKIDKCGYDEIYASDCQERIYNVMDDVLSKKEKELVIMRHVDNDTISDIMKKLKISRKEFTQLETSAMAKLKSNEIIKELK